VLSKNNIKFINSLRYKKYRQIHQHFFVEGEKLVNEAFHSGFNIKQIIATEKGLKSFDEKLLINKNLIITNEKELKKISAFTTPNKIFAIIEIPETNNYKIEIQKELVLGFEEINDPGNFGTIIRTADWFGIKTVFCSTNSVDIYNPKVVQATMGAVFRVKLICCDLKKIVNLYKNKMNVYGTFISGNNIFNEELPDNGLILFGNESKGLSEELESLVDYKITIPNYSNKNIKTESLNISSAVAIVCAQFRNK